MQTQYELGYRDGYLDQDRELGFGTSGPVLPTEYYAAGYIQGWNDRFDERNGK